MQGPFFEEGDGRGVEGQVRVGDTLEDVVVVFGGAEDFRFGLGDVPGGC